MEKVMVNKVVAGWIEGAKHYYRNSTTEEHRINKLMLQFVLKETGSTDFIDQNIDIVTLAKAIQYGYEVPYEFKVGDIVKNSIGDLIEITEKQSNSYQRSVEYANHDPELLKLVCKAENREDLK